MAVIGSYFSLSGFSSSSQLGANLMEEGGAARRLLPEPPRSFITLLVGETKMYSGASMRKGTTRFSLFHLFLLDFG